MIDIRKYNYYSWIREIQILSNHANLGPKILDIGCNDGTFLKMALSHYIDSEGIGFDISIKENSTKINTPKATFLWADLCYSEKIPPPQTASTIFFMNMFYILPTLTGVESFLRKEKSDNLFITVPNPTATQLFDKRNPNTNFYNRNLDAFIIQSGYRIYKSKPVTGKHYLAQPLSTLLGSLSNVSNKVIENFSTLCYYDLIWCKKT